MNKIYKLKYDRRRNQLVAVSELTTGAGKEDTGSVAGLSGQQYISTFRRLMGTLTPLAVMTGLVIGMLPGLALANPDLPVGGQVVAGQGSISTSGNQMTIHQNTHGLVTNWNSFDIGQNHRVQFVQPDSSAVALNRVTGGHESQILGTLTANGQVMLVNPAGVMFGKGAKVNTAGLLASTKNISTEDFMAGRYTFSGGSHPGAEIVNQGSLTTTKGGYIVLTADRVRNSGSITTPSGKTVLAAADRVTLQLDNTGLASVSVNGSVVNALVENSGLIAATNGQVYLTARGKEMLLNTVVNNSGTVEARGLNQRGGEIVLDGGDSGVVSQSGMLLADSETGRGGNITVQGANIHLTGGSRTSATGRTGGGEVYVGGGWQGKDTAIRNASKVVTDRDAVIDVSATERGDGGKAVLWSEDYTNFRGLILAKGGAQSGNGGQVETSSHNNLQAFGDVEVSALNGHGGNWLLDPTNVTIVAGADKNVGNASNVFTPSDNGAQIGVGSIQNQLNKGANVTIKTSGHDIAGQQGNITVNAVVNKTSGDDATLALLADGNIVTADRAYKAPDFISSTNGKLNLVMQAGNGGSITLGKYFKASLNGGDFTAGVNNSGGQGEGIYFNQSNGGYIKAGNITIDAPGRGYHGYAPSMTATGNLTIKGKMDVNTGWAKTATFKAGDTLKLNAPTGDIVFAATDTTNDGGRVVLSGDKGVIISTDNGRMTLKSAGGKQNSLDVTSSGGGVILTASLKDDGSRNSVLTLTNAAVSALKGDVSISGISLGGMEGLTASGLTVDSGGATELSGKSVWGRAANLTGLTLTSTDNVAITGSSGTGAWSTGLKITGSKINSTNGNITLTGKAGSDPKNEEKEYGNGLEITSSTITSGGYAATNKITLNGTSSVKSGVLVTGSHFSAAALDILGAATQWGTGFSLSTSELKGELGTLTNVTFSSAGSASGVTNNLDASIVTEVNRDTLLAKHTENMTRIDMAGASIFNDSASSVKGWTADFTSADTPYGGWLFANTGVTAAGTVDLKGVGFTDSTIAVSDGDFRITNNGLLTLKNTPLSVTNGNVSLVAVKGIMLSGSNVTAGKDISLNASHGGVEIKGINQTDGMANITSNNGNVLISGDGSGLQKNGVSINNAEIKALSGDIDVTGTGDSKCTYCSDKGAGITFSENVSFNSQQNHLNGLNNRPKVGGTFAGIIINKANVTFTGNTTIDALSDYGAGLMFESVDSVNSSSLKFINGTSFINATTRNEVGKTADHLGAIYIDSWNNQSRYVPFSVSNSTLNIEAKGNDVNGITSFIPDGWEADNNSVRYAGYKFAGQGDVNINASSVSGNGVELRILDNTDLKGNFTVNGQSESGAGVIVSEFANVTVHNATIKGSSETGAGIRINAADRNTHQVNLSGNTLTGTSGAGTGINISGNKVTITNGSLNGTSDGSGAGVLLTGGKDYTVDGATVIGQSQAGSGVSVGGNLTVSNATVSGDTATGSGVNICGNLSSSNTTITGNASASGSGVLLTGRVTGDDTEKNVITGSSAQGDGLILSGEPAVTEVTLNGNSEDGDGIKVTGNLTTNNVVATGNASGNGSGISMAGNISGGQWTGNAANGTGVNISGDSTLTDVSLSGTTTTGTGVGVSGNLTTNNVV
ncbi:filamentous hemagglutinin N-terminal domain-containing protein, partial [Salmonella enterica subsp. enterica]|nr:filamentous hemagglutinin N-terminal domain-containing protein [Salmonella enterica subsp. enterica]